MDDIVDDPRYHPKSYSASHHDSSDRRKIDTRNTQYARPVPNRYAEEDDYELDDFDEGNGPEDQYNDEEDKHRHGFNRNFDAEEDFERLPKKRKAKNSESRYEFAPRVRPNWELGFWAEEEWTEHAVFMLLEVRGDRFLQLGRKSLRSDDWHEVAYKVSEASKIERTDRQCKSMLDMLKRKYKKEKEKMEEMGLNSSKWAYFKKMEMLMASSSRQEFGLACGIDSGEYVFMNTRVYLERSNGFDEMRDSPGESETDDDDENGNEDFDVFPPRMAGMGMGGGDGDEGSSYRVLTGSIHKFGEIYEKIESSKRQQMRELEKMRKIFNKELELQKKQILDRAQVEIAKIQEADDDDETDVSVEDLSE
ncbi:hypothetical protein ACFX13_018077 [Malus domestica]